MSTFRFNHPISFIHSLFRQFVCSIIRSFVVLSFVHIFCLSYHSFHQTIVCSFVRPIHPIYHSFVLSINCFCPFYLKFISVPSPVHSFVLSIFCSTYHLFILSIMHSFIRSTCHSFYLSFICFCLFFLSFVRSRYCLFILLFVLSISFIRYIYIYNGIYHNIVNFHFKKLYFQDHFL